MSAYTRYAAHADMGTIIHARDEIAMLTEMHEVDPEMIAYPVSGDALAIRTLGTHDDVKRRRKIAQAVRSVGAL